MARSTDEARERAGQSMSDDQRPRAAAGDSGGDTADTIRRRAYELYQARGGTGGSDMDDWLAAEREVREHGIIAPMGDRGPSGATGATTAAAGTEGSAAAANALGGEPADAGAQADAESAGAESAGAEPAGGRGPATRRSRRGRAD